LKLCYKIKKNIFLYLFFSISKGKIHFSLWNWKFESNSKFWENGQYRKIDRFFSIKSLILDPVRHLSNYPMRTNYTTAYLSLRDKTLVVSQVRKCGARFLR